MLHDTGTQKHTVSVSSMLLHISLINRSFCKQSVQIRSMQCERWQHTYAGAFEVTVFPETKTRAKWRGPTRTHHSCVLRLQYRPGCDRVPMALIADQTLAADHLCPRWSASGALSITGFKQNPLITDSLELESVRGDQQFTESLGLWITGSSLE